jgi:2-polyprenyl-6-hydroxyphenyl methylase/3-demethylubiquinone-9 3-methyltransferase
MLRPRIAARSLLEYRNNNRGMTIFRDMIDWMGGFPFEFATYDLLEKYMQARGFSLIRGRRATSLGCHEMAFRRAPNA